MPWLIYISVKCPDLSNPTNGNVSVETDGQTTTALFTCTAGYHIFGEAVLSCNILGDWNFTEPQCGKYSFEQTCNKVLILVCSSKQVYLRIVLTILGSNYYFYQTITQQQF